MDKLLKTHYDRVYAAVLKKHTAASIATWIPENTKIGIIPFSYDGHEYQQRILSDTSQEVNVRKCSQVGISEVSSRKALALVNVLSPYTVCYTLPTASFAATFMRTRIDPIINSCEAMKGNINSTNDNSELKQFGDSFLYLKGAASSNAPISIPVDHLIHDEWDFSDQEVLGQYTSRLTHSPWKKVDRFSTPTLPGYGIDLKMQESRRHFLFCRCNHCNHFFIPSYYDHVKIPGYYRDLREINKQVLSIIKWEEAVLLCPRCGKEPSLLPQYREWVCENASERHVAAGYQVSPFDAPRIITPGSLVKASTSYARRQDFDNFNLGLAAEDNEATLTREDFAKIFQIVEVGSGYSYVMGIDVGNVYHFVIGAVDGWGRLIVVHTEQVPMGLARKKYAEFKQKWPIICTVIDSAPHAETVMALQAGDPNLYASVYMRSKSILTHHVVDKENEPDKAKEFVRQVNVNRSRAFDAYMEFLRAQMLTIVESAEKENIIMHHCSMKRVKLFDSDSGEAVFSWQKTDGNDHYHHAFLYCWLASKIKGLFKATAPLPIGKIGKFRVRTH